MVTGITWRDVKNWGTVSGEVSRLPGVALWETNKQRGGTHWRGRKRVGSENPPEENPEVEEMFNSVDCSRKAKFGESTSVSVSSNGDAKSWSRTTSVL